MTGPAGGPARRLAADVRSGRRSAAEVLAARRALAERTADLNALVATDWDRAARAAAGIDARRAAGRSLGPLAGVPFTVKDVIAVAGLPVTAASRALAGNLATTTAPAVEQLLAADAVLLGKTNCPEFAFGMTCTSELFGETRNPVFPDRSPGGSSGGEAAAVAAGISTVGIGTDFGGSVRWPAACTGLVALRPTAGAVDPRGQIPGLGGSVAAGDVAWPATSSMQGQLQVIGPIARRVDDLVLALSVLRSPLAPVQVPGDHPVRLGWTTGTSIGPVRAEIAAAVAAAAARLESTRGWPATELDDPFAGCLAAYNTLRESDPLLDHLRAVAGRAELVTSVQRATFAASLTAGPDALARAWREALAARAAALDAFTGPDAFDAVLLPVAGGPACLPDGSVDVDGTTVTGWPVMSHLRVISLLGAPAVSVPVGTGADGLPISVQVVAAPWRDGVALRVAAALEAA